MYCENCGSKTDNTAKFCRNCGKPVKTPARLLEEVIDDIRNLKLDSIDDKMKALDGAPGPEITGRLNGDINFLKGNYEAAYAEYMKISPEKRGWDTSLNLALINLNRNRAGDAIKCLESIEEKKVDLSKSFIYSKRYKKKETLFTDVHLYLGVLYRDAAKKAKAIKSFEKVLSYDLGNDLAYANLGDIYFKDDKYDEAIKNYEKAIALSSEDMKKSHLFNDLGFAYFRKGLNEEAISCFRQAIILNPSNNNAVHNLGVIYVKGGMQDKVKDDYKEFLKYEGGVDIVFNLSKSIMNVAKGDVAGDAKVDFIGEHAAIKKVKHVLVKAAETDSTVFIQGENGTGKELAARAIHRLSKRAEKPFVVVNCGALPETLLESELFGYEKGAFTGAVKEKQGRFEIADTGTVFLDEIGDITPAMQVKLLRFVQEKEFERVGGTKTQSVDVRIITATNRDIKEMVESGQFREDLFYRIYVLPVTLPPLRERGNDIFILAGHFLKEFSEAGGKKFRSISKEVMEIFYNYPWPGNVRELENVMERIVTLYDDFEIKPEHLPEEIADSVLNPKSGIHSRGKNTEDEKSRIIDALSQVNYSKTKAAARLGISRVALWKKMKKLNIS